jgi:hypothetical protein
MARGGKRRGAGRKPGPQGPQAATLAKQQVEEAYRAFMVAEKEALWRAQRERACGVYVLLVQTDEGYVRVTDPDLIAEIVQTPNTRGKTAWLIEAQAPDARLAKEINDRLMGVPTQVHEVGTGDGAPLAVRIVHREVK